MLPIPCTPEEIHLLELISKASQQLDMHSFVVGGFVRDKLIDRECKDIDVVCLGDGIELAHTVARFFKPEPPVAFYKNFGTAQIKVNDFDIEFVGARKESYQSDSRKPSVEPGSITDDQNRRDLTINALAMSLNPENFGELIDPFGGLHHLDKGILQTPLHPDKTFIDDPLRMMRVVRFAAQLHFKIEEETYQSLTRNAERLQIISKERIIDEFNKILRTPKPSIGLAILFKTGLLKQFFPELVDLAGAAYVDGLGHKDNFYHTIQVVDQIAPHTDNIWLRWAALLHDIGKPATKHFEPGHGWTFHHHEWIGSKMIPAIFKRLKLPLHEEMKYVQKIVQLHHRPVSLTKEEITDSAVRRLLFDAGQEIDDLMTLCRADITTKNEIKMKRFQENFECVSIRLKEVEETDKIRNWQPVITGEIIMTTFNLTPSRTVGLIKDAIREAILDGDIKNDYQEAYDFMINKAKELHLQPVKQP
jgi:poly(A) polymerase